MAGERLQRLGGAVHGRYGKIMEFQKIRKRFPHRVVVVDDEDSFAGNGIAVVRTAGRKPGGVAVFNHGLALCRSRHVFRVAAANPCASLVRYGKL